METANILFLIGIQRIAFQTFRPAVSVATFIIKSYVSVIYLFECIVSFSRVIFFFVRLCIFMTPRAKLHNHAQNVLDFFSNLYVSKTLGAFLRAINFAIKEDATHLCFRDGTCSLCCAILDGSGHHFLAIVQRNFRNWKCDKIKMWLNCFQ